MNVFEAGIGAKQVVRFFQWLFGIPVAFAFIVGLFELEVDDPVHQLATAMVGGNEWFGYLFLFAIAGAIEMSDRILMERSQQQEYLVHELVKNIGDRLRTGSAVETAVAEACRTTKGPSDVFQQAVELADQMPFDSALREAADQCGSPYLREVAYLVAEAVRSQGDIGGAVRRLGMELERNAQFTISLQSKLQAPTSVLRGVGLFAVPPLFALLRYQVLGASDSANRVSKVPANLFLAYGAIAITFFDGMIFNQWDRIFARLPLAVAAVYIGMHWIG